MGSRGPADPVDPRATTFDEATWPTAKTVLARALAMRSRLAREGWWNETMSGRFGRVLIVDDEGHVSEVLRDFLTNMGDEVVTAASAAEALELVPTFQPEVILTDMKMPGAAPQSFGEMIGFTAVSRSLIHPELQGRQAIRASALRAGASQAA